MVGNVYCSYIILGSKEKTEFQLAYDPTNGHAYPQRIPEKKLKPSEWMHLPHNVHLRWNSVPVSDCCEPWSKAEHVATAFGAPNRVGTLVVGVFQGRIRVGNRTGWGVKARWGGDWLLQWHQYLMHLAWAQHTPLDPPGFDRPATEPVLIKEACWGQGSGRAGKFKKVLYSLLRQFLVLGWAQNAVEATPVSLRPLGYSRIGLDCCCCTKSQHLRYPSCVPLLKVSYAMFTLQ